MNQNILPLALASVLLPYESARPVPDFRNRYWVTDAGRVISLVGELRVLKPSDHSKGYLRVDLHRGRDRAEGVSYRRVAYVHELVAEAFIGPRPSRPGVAFDIDHVDGDKHNNQAGNLRYLPKGENVRLMRLHRPHPSEKLAAAEVWELRCRAHAEAASRAEVRDLVTEAAERFGVTVRTVRDAVSGRTWSCVPQPPDLPSVMALASALRVGLPEALRLLKLSPFHEALRTPENFGASPTRRPAA